MDIIQYNADNYKYLKTIKNENYSSYTKANVIVKKFIKDKQLILYGGTAIDMLLRTVGDKIYPDELVEVADLDFYSPNNITDAYELVDILYKAGFLAARTITAIHYSTMRVDIGNNTWVADISYMNPDIFKSLKFYTYEDLRVIDPTFQRIDMHLSLSSPCHGPPRENALNRYNKDIKRYNLLDKYFPITDKLDDTYDNIDIIMPIELLADILGKSKLLSGIYAFILYKKYYTDNIPLMHKTEINTTTFICNYDKYNITFTIPILFGAFIDFNILCGDLAENQHKNITILKKYVRHNSLLIPKRYTFELMINKTTTISGNLCELTEKQMVTKYNIGNRTIHLASVQYIMMELLTNALYYSRNLEMMIYRELHAILVDIENLPIDKQLFYPNTNIFGDEKSETYHNFTKYLNSQLYGAEDIPENLNYKIVKNNSVIDMTHPTINADNIYHFKLDGRQLQ